MTRAPALVLLAGMALAGCSGPEPPRTQQQVSTVATGVLPDLPVEKPQEPGKVDSVFLLKRENNRLSRELGARDSFIEAYLSLIQETTARLNSISADESAIRTMTSNLLQNELSGQAANVTDVREQVNRKLDELEKYIRAQKSRSASLQSSAAYNALQRTRTQVELSRSRLKLGQYEQKMSDLNRSTQQLSLLLELKENEIAMLRSEVKTQFQVIERLRSENQTLRTAYLAVGTNADLRAKRLITRPALRGTRPLYEEIPGRSDAFAQIDIQSNVILISADPVRRARVLSNQREYPDSYAFDSDNRTLRILKPEVFWQAGRHLIVEIQP